MRQIYYFNIEATNAALDAFPKLLDKGDAELLLEPVLTSRYGGGVGFPLCRSKYLTTLVKLLYLARLREYIFLTASEDAVRILGSDAISTKVFDRWWTLSEMQWDEPSEHWESYLRAFTEKIQLTGDPEVDELLQAHLRR
ncbi:hypothetical protein [Comamonas squillarum]|uniref:Uncharacterized protein n=1 Tax=Comamonas squillarum TaxID=2977320 RepID=A0ABY6A3G2_9BURK|nr:hypothetical protein [Comamonas sp. PR12]UXC20509.1 hypothetical protein N4T19_10540 [Comamonas sp. PR12]